jgi:cell division protease FtsH
MDGFTPNDNVIVMAATNRGDLLDPALLRPGRFDRRVVLDMPDKDGRLSILKIHAKNKKFASEINWGRVADRTVGFSGADLENMLNEAAILAARDDEPEILMKDIEEAATKVKMGPAKRRLQSEEDRRITAYHEAGHAIVTHFLPKMDPVHRISIVARGMSLGHTLIPPAADRTHETRGRLLDQIAAMLGGRAAEEVVFNEMTAGASNDIEHATALARAMVTDFGMSDALGPVNFDGSPDPDGNPFAPSSVSPATLERIDKEVQKILLDGREKAMVLVKKHRKSLDIVSEELLKKETLDRDEFEELVGVKKEEKSKLA